ncbi:MAG: glutamate synthase-related protein [Myxococcota bacterium]|nr:glutamate synthase-related protein [Myxococcota bacterium]
MAFKAYQAEVDGLQLEPGAQGNLRSLLRFSPQRPSIPLDEVEPAAELMKRFCTGAMSLGSISAPAHETLAVAMNQIGGRSNSGEGGEEPHRSQLDEAGASRQSAIRQIASGRFGVHLKYLTEARELQIKIAQGAKPGEGGQLPGYKVSERIATVRCSTPGVTLISPPPHHDIYSIEDLAQLIYDLKAVNKEARVSVKLVSELGVGTVAAGVAKTGAGAIIIAGDQGGTGASPLSSLRHTGLPWELGLAEAQQVLIRNGLRSWVRLQVDGGLRSARDVMVAALLGAEEFAFSTAPLVSMGCILLRKCHMNSCSVGIATQDPELIERFAGTPAHVVRFFSLLAEELRVLMAELGYRRFEELIGAVETLEIEPERRHWKAAQINLERLLNVPGVPLAERRSHPDEVAARAPIQLPLDERMIPAVLQAMDQGTASPLTYKIENTDRAVGARLSAALMRAEVEELQIGENKHPQVEVTFKGIACQSFGAFLAPKLRFQLFGEANDYVGKGLSGGTIVITPPPNSALPTEEQVILGNVALYGATGGQLFAAGCAGERFAVRNSGATAVVEGVGAHGCEYMTGGEVVILSLPGRNFAAGMSGGLAFVHDPDSLLETRCNPEMVDLEPLSADAGERLHELLKAHLQHTGSTLTRRLLERWSLTREEFTFVIPREYRAARQQKAQAPQIWTESVSASPSRADVELPVL